MSFNEELNNHELPLMNGKVVHARPKSVKVTKTKVTISREQLENSKKPQIVSSDTTLLNEEEEVEVAKLDRKPIKLEPAKEAIYTPDTTVLGFEDPIVEKEEEKPNTINGRVPVEVPSSAEKKKALKKLKQVVKPDKPELKKISREALEKPEANDLSTTVIAEPEPVEDIKPVVKPKPAPKRIPKIIKKISNKECILIRISNQENIKIEGDSFVIGKSKFSNYQVKGNNTISRSHAIFSTGEDGSVYIEDNESKNGTCLDGQYLKPHDKHKLSDGQTIRMSDEVFRVKFK